MNIFKHLKIASGSLLALFLAVSTVQAADHTITARSTAYDPMVLKIEPGDTVNWVNMSGHFN